MMVSTTKDLTGFKIVRHLGIVRGITVRSRRRQFGRRSSVHVRRPDRRLFGTCGTSRQEAFDHMCAHAAQAGANAVVGMRYDANEIMDGITEVLAYGTAVWAEPLAG